MPQGKPALQRKRRRKERRREGSQALGDMCRVELGAQAGMPVLLEGKPNLGVPGRPICNPI
jgi:hypothetical protein